MLNTHPCREFGEFCLLEKGAEISKQVIAMVSRLPNHIGQREVDTICRKAGWRKKCGRVIEVSEPRGPGNVVMIEIEYENVTSIFTAFGQQGVKAERVAAFAYRQAKRFLDSGVPVEEYLADQLMLPMGIAASQGRTCSFRTYELSGHSHTHLEILKRFLDVTASVKSHDDGSFTVTLSPK